MALKQFPAVLSFFSNYLSNTNGEDDVLVTRAFMEATSEEIQSQVIHEFKLLIGEAELSLEELGAEANRWFAEQVEANAWMNQILNVLQSSQKGGEAVVKDSNGAILQEGDSVTVIKDLKVKGGSSDLKRGTQIKKIHLVGDPEAVECRVDGSTLVLKTCFLRKI